MSMVVGRRLVIAFVCFFTASYGCSGPQHRAEIRFETPMQCYKETALKNDASSLLERAAINAALYAATKNSRTTMLQSEKDYYSWGQCLDMFSGLSTHEEVVKEDDVKYTWVSPDTRLLQIITSVISQSDVGPGDSDGFKIVYQLKAPTDRKEIDVTEIRRLKAYDERGRKYIEVGRSEKTLSMFPGKYRTDGFISVPDGLRGGKFMLDIEISAYDISEHAEMPFVVLGAK